MGMAIPNEPERMGNENADGEPVKLSDWLGQLLTLLAKYDSGDCLLWNEELEFFVMCNDAFWWGTADAEPVTADTLQVLNKSFEDAGNDGALLYCARQRKLRPQGAVYKYIDRKNWGLFDSCGPERCVTDPGNTPKPE